MNTYFSMLGRLIDGKTPIEKKGYYILCDDDSVRFSLERPQNVKTIDTEQFVDNLVKGCKEILYSFSNSRDNQEVYAFSLYVNEHKTILVYINTLQRFDETLHTRYPHYVENMKEKNDLKYNLGDFYFNFWSQHMGDFGKIIDHFEKFADYPSYEGDEQPLHRGDHPIIAFEAGIINSGYVALVLEAVTRLHTEHAFDLLKRTKNFIAFASTDNDYISYSLIMRKTIHENQLYEVFPDLKDYDVQFHKWVDQFRHLPASDALDYLQETFLHNYYLDLPFSLIRSEYDVFQQLEHLGNTLADECLKQLHNLANIEELNQNESSLGYCYIEALFFSGELTPEQKNSCSQLYNIFLDKNEVYIARELNLLIEQMN